MRERLKMPELRIDHPMIASPVTVPTPQARSTELSGTFPNLLSQFVYTRTYSRWRPELGRRETWDETVDRYVAFIDEERRVPSRVLEFIHQGILKMDVLPSMRALWSAGDAARRDNTCCYNCAHVPLDSLRSFTELLYILMMGTGIGYSVEKQFIDNLPAVAPMSKQVAYHHIPDSTVGWADAFYFGLQNWFEGRRVAFDFSSIRPAGAPLLTKGGRASGPDPLMRLLDFAEETILSAAGRKLRPIEAHDIGRYDRRGDA